MRAMASNRSISTNVLGVREDGEWSAIALELNLRGYGETFDLAVKDLTKAMEAQISFALQHGTLDSIFVPAEPEYFRIYADMKRERMKSTILHADWADTHYMVEDVPLPSPDPEQFEAA